VWGAFAALVDADKSRAALVCYCSGGMPGSGHGKTWMALDAASHTARAEPDGSAARPITFIPFSVCVWTSRR
jgi:hypothetical protein